MSLGKQKKQEVKPQIIQGPSEKKGREFLTGLLDRQYQAYPTENRFAEFPQQQALADSLTSYLGRETSPLRQAGVNRISSFLDIEDPTKSAGYLAKKGAITRELQQTEDQFLRSQSLRGARKGTGTARGLGDLYAGANNRLADILAEDVDQQEARAERLIPQAFSAADTLESAPLRSAQAIQQISPTLQAIEQQPLDFEFAQFMQEQGFDFNTLAPIAQQLIASPETFMFPQYAEGKPSPWGPLLGLAGSAVGNIIAPGIGGAVGGYFGNQLGSQI